MQTNEPTKHTKLWCVVRIQDYRLTLLDDSEEWTDPGDSTFITSDREAAYQAGRRNGGLLMNVSGMPGSRAYGRFRDSVAAMMATLAPQASPASDDAGENVTLPGSKAAKLQAAQRAAAGRASKAGDGDEPAF